MTEWLAVDVGRYRYWAQEFYEVRSDVVHNRLHRLTPERVHAAFCNGFEIARRSVFKLLREGPPEDWNSLGDTVG